ncbi:MAG: hypothetical protein WA705_12270 [Candidatus Ozemobacteraceae bacterium]
MKKNRPTVTLFVVLLLLSLAQPFFLQATPLTAQVHERAGKGILFGLQKVFQTVNQAGGDDFKINLTSSKFSSENTHLQLQIDGSMNALGWTTRVWLIKYFSTEMPLPQRPECRGFLKFILPADTKSIADNAVVQTKFTCTLDVKVDECLKIIGMAIVGTGLSHLTVFQSDAFLQILDRIPQQNVQIVLQKFFPRMFSFLAKRSAKKFFDELQLDGQVTGIRILTQIGLDEITGFSMSFGLGLAQSAAVGCVQGAVGVGVGAAVCTMPFFGNVAVGAIIVAITGKTADSLINFGINSFEAGLYRDRFAKIEGWLLGTYSPGVNQADWLVKQVATEAKKDDYSSLQRLVIHIQRVSPLKRGFWQPYVNKLRSPVEFQARQDGSWVAQKYLGILDVLFAQ